MRLIIAVMGCGTSVPLDDSKGYKNHSIPINHTLRGVDKVISSRRSLKRLGRGVLSCADVVSIATSDGIMLDGGRTFIHISEHLLTFHNQMIKMIMCLFVTSIQYRDLSATLEHRSNPMSLMIGMVIESASDFFTGRLTRKEREGTIAVELLSDVPLLTTGEICNSILCLGCDHMTISQHDVLSLKGKKNVVFSFVKELKKNRDCSGRGMLLKSTETGTYSWVSETVNKEVEN
ncbi:hypothetical protein SO802_010631 [Lithocarpus litseifolius]|uniref:Plant heme peroxidase family profile domain-containing protein n=1 Tax=Lithocarpus litseifolius TaxID=425828 RepID=A0AAW2DHS6_9ROSI